MRVICYPFLEGYQLAFYIPGKAQTKIGLGLEERDLPRILGDLDAGEHVIEIEGVAVILDDESRDSAKLALAEIVTGLEKKAQRQAELAQAAREYAYPEEPVVEIREVVLPVRVSI